jgi:Zn-dependent protease with chaperone function
MGARKKFTEREKQIQHWFDDVYESVRIARPRTKKRIKFYITDELDINAYATNNAIAITKGAVSLPMDEIKGLIAHEFAHIECHYPMFLAFLKGSTCLATFMAWIYNKFLARHIIADLFFIVPSFYFWICSAVCFRKNEFYADKFAVVIGYGDGLKNALTMIYQMEINGKKKLNQGITQRLMSSHPSTAYRIDEIEYNQNKAHKAS